MLRKGVLSVAFALWFVALAAVTLVGFPGTAAVARHAQAAVTLATLDQDWRLFAPPPQEALRFEAETTWSDGVRTTWSIPTSGPWLGAYTDYRWRKWAENAGSGADGPRLWPAAARYVLAHEPRRADAHPTQLRLLRRTQPIPPAGTPRSQRWTSTEVYAAQLAPGAS